MAIQRVAFVSMHTSPADPPGTADAGGMNVSLLAVAAAIAATGVEVDLLTRAREHAGSQRLGPGVTVRSIAVGPAGSLAKGDLVEVSDQFGEEVARLAGTDGTRYDVIHAHYWLSGIATLPVALELSIPFVQTFHTLATMKDDSRAPGDAPESERRRLSERFLAGQADAVIAVSAAEATHVVETMGAPAARVWVVPPGVDLTLFSPRRSDQEGPVREKFGVPENQRLLVMIGRIQPLKGHELAIRALAALPEPRPALLIAGEPTPGAEDYRRFLGTLAAELGVARNVQFVGALDREAIADLLAVADLTLIPSFSETFGLVALESAASGTPVVASFSTGLKESVAEGQSGLLIASRDAGDWAARMSELLSDPVALSRLGQTARHFAERSGWNSTAVGLLSIYSSLERR